MLLKIQKTFFSLIIGMTPYLCYAHGAHEHGTANIDIALQDKDGTIYIKVPGESIYGFEHEAKNESEKKKVKESSDKLKKNILEIVKFDSSLGCSITSEKISPFITDPDDDDHDEGHDNDTQAKNSKILHGHHGEFQAEFTIKCKKPTAGSQVKFAFTTYFPKIQKIIVQLNSDKVQTSTTVSKNKGYLQL